jgi:hypothetical protein
MTSFKSISQIISDAIEPLMVGGEIDAGVEADGQSVVGLFGDMPLAVPVTIDGRKIKAVMALTRDEAEWVIALREKQVAADTRSVRRFRYLYTRALPFWNGNPGWTWADCLKAAAGNDNNASTAAVAA